MAPDFEELLDSSLQSFRQRLLDAYVLSHDRSGVQPTVCTAEVQSGAR